MVRIFLLLSWMLVLGSLTTFIPGNFALLEINANLGGYYLVAFIGVLLGIAIFCRQLRPWPMRLLTAAVLLCVFKYAKIVAPFYLDPPRQAAGSSLRLLLFNPNQANISYDAMRSYFQEKNPEILVILEYTYHLQQALGLATQFPTHIELPSKGHFGLALFSRLPLIGKPQTSFGDNLPDAIDVTLQTTQGPLAVIAYHAIPPLSTEAVRQNYLLHRRVTARVRNADLPTIIAADLNATPFSKFYGMLTGNAKLRSAIEGFGMQRSWNAGNPLLRFTIDHVLYNGPLTVRAFERGPDLGSDHFPIVVDFVLPVG